MTNFLRRKIKENLNFLFLMKLLIFFWGALNLQAISASELTEKTIHAMISSVENAVEIKDIQGVSDAFSDDAKIIRYVEIRGEKRLEEQSKGEYLKMLAESWEIFTDYEFVRSKTSISIKNNEAFVTSNIEEYATFQHQRMKSTSQQEVIVEVIGGIPLITKMVSYISVEDLADGATMLRRSE
jgi:ketosteroid isomerase-like protein